MKLTSSKYQIAAAAPFAILPLMGHAQADPQNQSTSTLAVHVMHARNSNGKIGVTLFKTADGFPSDTAKAILRQSVDIDPHKSECQRSIQECSAWHLCHCGAA